MHFDMVIKRLSKKVAGMDSYSVVYKDRFVGMIECDLDVFMNNPDIPTHRAWQIKQSGKVVWD